MNNSYSLDINHSSQVKAYFNSCPVESEAPYSRISTLFQEVPSAARSRQSLSLLKTPSHNRKKRKEPAPSESERACGLAAKRALFQPQNSRQRNEPTPEEYERATSVVKRALFEIPFPDPLEIGHQEGHARPDTFNVVDRDTFEKFFDPDVEIPDVETDSYMCLQKKQNQPFMTTGVASCLAIGIKGLDPDGSMSFRAIGHFSIVNIQAFIHQIEGNAIKKLLDSTFAASPNAEIFIAGMYDDEQFEEVQQRIEQDYHPHKLESYPNPWKVPGQRLRMSHYDEDLEAYLLDQNIALTMGMTPEGEVLVTAEDPNSPLQFSEEAFQNWQIERQVSKAAAERVKAEMPPLPQQESTPIEVIKREEFKRRFPSEGVKDLYTDEWELVPCNQKRPLMTKGVATCLAIAVRCFDSEGQPIYYGLGHFGNVEYAGEIQDFLDQAASKCTTLEIFAAGMHSDEDFKEVQTLFEEYNPTRIETIINPWKFPEDADKRADSHLLGDYVDEFGGSLCMGIKGNGEIYVADEPCQPSASSSFLQFNEEAFEEWKQSRGAELA